MEIKVRNQIHPLSNWTKCGSDSKSWRRVSATEPLFDTCDLIALWYIAQADCCYYVSFEGSFRFIQKTYDSCFTLDVGKYIYTTDADQLKNQVDNFIIKINSLKVFL